MKKIFTLALMCLLAFVGYSQEPGTLNSSFGDEGIARISGSSYFDIPAAILESEDGKILTIGKSRTDGTNYKIYMSRQNADGSIDNTFGTNGFFFYTADPSIYLNEGKDAVFGNNGLIFIAGHTYDYTNNKGFVLCVDENGFAYPNFGTEGFAVSELGCNWEAIDIDSHGRPIVTGYSNDTLIVRRYNVAGLPDPSFGTGGSFKMAVPESLWSFGFTIKVLDDDKILVGGSYMQESFMVQRPFLCRLKANGTIDTTFGEEGFIKEYVGELSAYALTMDVQGENYIVGGHLEIDDESDLPTSETYITRVLNNGTIDQTFGTNGFTTFKPFDGTGLVNSCYAVTVAEDGQIFGTIYSYNHNNTASRAYVFNLDAEGQPKESFAGTGLMAFNFSDPEVQSTEILLSKTGNILVSGYLYDGDWGSDIFVASVNTDIEGEEPEPEAADIELEVSAVDAHTIKAIVTPNEFTTEYHIGYVSKEMFDQVGEETFAQALQADGNPQTGANEFTYGDLTKLTTYVVIVTAKNDADEWIVKSAEVATPDEVGCGELESFKFNVYPNPATSTVFIESNSNAQVSIIDMTGRVVKEVETTENVTVIGVDDINKGVYFIMIQNENNRIVEKLVVK